jgi:hypothetical protein
MPKLHFYDEKIGGLVYHFEILGALKKTTEKASHFV